MPKRLPERCGPDCIHGFRGAAVQRYADGIALAAAGNRTAAIHLWGYCVEMWLKIGFFRAMGYGAQQGLSAADLRAAMDLAPSVGVTWAGRNLHHLPSWCQLLVATRSAFGPRYPSVYFPTEMIRETTRMNIVWRETLRYHDNTAYEHEARAARTAVDWFREHAPLL